MEAAWTGFLHGAGPAGHAVQVYRDVSELADSVIKYLAVGFDIGEPAVVIARKLTRRAGSTTVHDDGVERIVRWVRTGQRQAQRRDPRIDRAHNHRSRKAGTSTPCHR